MLLRVWGLVSERGRNDRLTSRSRVGAMNPLEKCRGAECLPLDEAIAEFRAALQEIDIGDKSARCQVYTLTARCYAKHARHAEAVEASSKGLLVLPAATQGPDSTPSPHQLQIELLQIRAEANTSLNNKTAAEGDWKKLCEIDEPNQAKYRAYLSAAVAQEDPPFEEGYEGCKHYKRKCRVYCPDCKILVPCRLCHDDLPDITHKLDRPRIERIRCEKCLTVQPPAAQCVSCSVTFAPYYCDTCRLWTTPPATAPADFIWHCEHCGLCRLGQGRKGKSSFEHCFKCGGCWPKGSDHTCSGTTRQECPVCLEDLHTSTMTMQTLNCGHLVHSKCLPACAIACPLCRRTESSAFFDLIAAEVAMNPMPPEYRDKTQEILCNDCLKKNVVPLHFIAMKCPDCNSYNTSAI
eukprot:Sspe_Gene.14223::Locus_4911_Transcript_1_1_Confidence_1.000_Length_2096::g.14223::m.14223/K10144/RCHY1, PIRH2; RING finger and CHY zinc finger domain-containing protein 1